MEVWKLQVISTGDGAWEVCGTEEVMRAAYDEIKAILDAGDTGVAPAAFSVTGFWDTADRAESNLVLRTPEIRGARLTRMS